MKQFYTLLVLAFTAITANAQIVNIPDAAFKAKLLATSITNQRAKNLNGEWIAIDANGDSQIQISEAQNVSYINFTNVGSTIYNLTGIIEFSNLVEFRLKDANLIIVNLQELQHLEFFMAIYCGINEINMQNLPALKTLLISNNDLVTLDLSNLNSIEILQVHNNWLTFLDVSSLINLNNISCYNNELQYLNLKNGVVETINTGLHQISGNGVIPLSFICADEEQFSQLQPYINNLGSNAQYVVMNSYCSFTPGGTFYTTQGNTRFDNNNNGCDVNDSNIANQKFNLNNGSVTGTVISNSSGSYSIPVGAGTHIITPQFESPNYFTVSPTSSSVTFPAATSPFTQNFCVTANGIKNDVEVTIISTNAARPGFDAKYKIIYRNKGNQVSNGSMSFNFDDAKMDLVSALPVNTSSATNSLSWNYTGLNPFETRTIELVFNINSPLETPAVNGGDVLTYTATIVGATDEMPNDNTMTLNQTVVNSYDPNDKTCLEGNTITPSMIGNYVHYVIRFENTGTFPAENVVVSDIIDLTKFELASLIPQSSSHSFVTRINNTTGKVEFIFENINLPFDDANNDGYVAFKIKNKSTLVLGNTFSNTANIYFDYNFPIVTNTTSTTVSLLSTQDFDFSSVFRLSPVPTKDVLTITNNQNVTITSVSIYNTLGQLVQVSTNPSESIDVSSLKTGNYVIKIISDKGTSSGKFVKE